MPIISKETWDKIPGVAQHEIKQCYNHLKDDVELNNNEISQLEWLFGKENLQPQPLTYEGVARELFSEDKGNAVFYLDQFGEISESNEGLADNLTNDPTNCTSEKQAKKLLAINKLLNVCAWADMRNELSIEISAELREKINGILTDKEFELIISNDY